DHPAVEDRHRGASARSVAAAFALIDDAGLAGEVVGRLDEADRPGPGAHDHRVRHAAAGKAAHALQHGAVGHAGGGEHDVALGELGHGVFAFEILDADAGGAAGRAVVAEQQPALHLAADAAQRGGRQYALGRAAGAEIDVDAAVRARGRDHARDVAV